jgi:hypothetical protein
MRNAGSAVIAGLLFSLLVGCEHAPSVTVPQLPPPAVSTSPSLSPAARAYLGEAIDVDALDRLLNTLGPEERTSFLRTFDDVELAASGRTDVETRGVTMTIRFGDPEQQMLLDHMWAPFWLQFAPTLLSDVSHPLPGRALAAARRADSTSAARTEPEP